MKPIAANADTGPGSKSDPHGTIDDRIVDPSKPIGMPKLPTRPAPLDTKYPTETPVKPQH